MGYQEDLIKDLREAKNSEKENYFNIENNIEKGYVIVKYEKLQLEEKEIYDGNLKMVLPKEFELMEDELVLSKYPGQDVPDYVYTSEDTTVNFNFSLERGEVSNEDIEEMRDIILNEFRRLYPASEMKDIKILETKEKKIGTFSFEVPVLDGNLFNRLYFIPLKIGLLILTFSCDIFQRKEWGKFIDEMILTVKENFTED